MTTTRHISLLCCCLGTILRAAEPVPIQVTVSDTILRPQVPRIGFEICQNPGEDKSTMLQNSLNPDPGLEDRAIFKHQIVRAPLNFKFNSKSADFFGENDHAPLHGGSTCIKLAMDPFWKITMVWLPSFKRFGGGRGGNREGNADRFLQEKTYRITLWAKGTPGAKGSVRFVASSEPFGAMPDDFVLTDSWKKYELIRKSEAMVNIAVVLTGGTDMYMDNFTISEDDGGTPCNLLPRVVDALAGLKPGTLRLLGGAGDECLDNWLAHPLERLRTAIKNEKGDIFYRDPDEPNLPMGLNLCERVGASPWLVMNPEMTEAEWDNLLEYLAGPATTPYGAKRVQNGQADSWLKTFDKVYLELGDAVWDTSKASSNVPNPATYAVRAERVFSRVRKSPYCSSKIRLVANGNASDPAWNAAVLKGCPDLDVLNCPAVIDITESNKPAQAHPFSARLLAFPARQALPQLTAATRSAQAVGKAFALGGCGTVSSEASFLSPERSALRSQAAAVAELDELLLALANGSETAIFSRFAQGSDNATHVDAHGMALHPAGLAVRLFNHHVGGRDLLRTDLSPTPTDGPAPGVPALAAYAFKGQGSAGVLLLNRSPATAYRANVKMSALAGKLHRYCIAGNDPLADNLNELHVTCDESEVDAATGVLVPAHSIVLGENEVK